MRHSQIHNYLAIARSLKTPSYKTVAILANVTRQAVFQAMKTAQVDLLFEARAQITKENKDFLRKVRKLNCSTEKLQPKEIARLAGLPNFKRAKQVLTNAGILFKTPTPGRGKINFDTVPSKLAQFARKLPATEHLTAKEIAKLAGLSHHKTPSTTLKRHGIPFKAGTKGSLRGVKKGHYSTGLVRFAKSLKSTEDLTAKEIAKLGGFDNHKSPGTTLKRHGIPFKSLTKSKVQNKKKSPVKLKSSVKKGTVSSQLAQFAKKLPATEHLTAIEIASLAGLSSYKWPSFALRRHGIPFKLRKTGSLVSEKKGMCLSKLALFAKSLKSTEDLTAKEIAKLAGFENHGCPGTTLKRHGIPFKSLERPKYKRHKI